MFHESPTHHLWTSSSLFFWTVPPPLHSQCSSQGWAVLSPTPLTQDEVRVCKAALVTNLGEIIPNSSVQNSWRIWQLQLHLSTGHAKGHRGNPCFPASSVLSLFPIYPKNFFTYSCSWAFPWLYSLTIPLSFLLFHLPLCCLWYVPGALKKSDLCGRAWSRARYNSAADRLKKRNDGLCCNMTAPSSPHPTA